jgi:hypothetical protein
MVLEGHTQAGLDEDLRSLRPKPVGDVVAWKDATTSAGVLDDVRPGDEVFREEGQAAQHVRRSCFHLRSQLAPVVRDGRVAEVVDGVKKGKKDGLFSPLRAEARRRTRSILLEGAEKFGLTKPPGRGPLPGLLFVELNEGLPVDVALDPVLHPVRHSGQVVVLKVLKERRGGGSTGPLHLGALGGRRRDRLSPDVVLSLNETVHKGLDRDGILDKAKLLGVVLDEEKRHTASLSQGLVGVDPARIRVDSAGKKRSLLESRDLERPLLLAPLCSKTKR